MGSQRVSQRSNQMSDSTASESTSASVFAPNAVADKLKDAIADRFKAAAGAIEQRTQVGQALEPLAEYGQTAAAFLQSSADYVRAIDPEQVRLKFESKVRENPGRSVLIAAAAGL